MVSVPTLELPRPADPRTPPDPGVEGPARNRRSAVRAEALVLAGLLVVAGTVHAVGMATYPNWVDDPGTYLSQAWSVQYWGQLSPYSYFYDHAPFGWIQIAAWSMLTNGFGRYGTAMAFGSECMLLAKLATVTLLYLLGRRYTLGRPAAALVVLIFALNPLVLHYSRIMYLDNLTVPWMLLAFWFAADRRGHLASVAGASVAFALAVLTKETAAVCLPALVCALWQSSHRSTRPKAAVVALAGGSLALMYPALAVVKGELLPGPDHNSLIGTLMWQLHERTPSGSLLDPSSPTSQLVQQWLGLDRWLLIGGVAATLAALLMRTLRPAALALVMTSLVFFTGGYVPFMHVVNLLPWTALLVVAVPVLALRHRVIPARARQVVSGALLVGLLAVMVGVWAEADRRMMTVPDRPPLAEADAWVGEHVPRDSVVVVHDSLWTDLVQKYGFAPQNVIVVSKVDADPAVNRTLRRIDYLVLPDYYFTAADGMGQYPTALAAQKRAVAVAKFGVGLDRAVTVYRVSTRWTPRG